MEKPQIELDTFEDFICISCKVNTHYIHEYYMIHDNLWEQANPKLKGMMCIGCVEDKVGRKLNTNDFPNYPINHLNFYHKSERLLDRLQNG